MRTRSILAACLLAFAGGASFIAQGCTKEREDVPGPGSGSGNPIGGTNPASGSGGDDGGTGGSNAGGDGSAGEGGAEGQGGGPETLPQCACLLDVIVTDACGTCVSFGVVDECGKLYSACQSDGDCVAVDNCVLEQRCENSACLDACRDLGTPEALDAFDAMYACVCPVCNDDCDTGDSCR